jgi:hypothetical protein
MTFPVSNSPPTATSGAISTLQVSSVLRPARAFEQARSAIKVDKVTGKECLTIMPNGIIMFYAVPVTAK